ncbi:hypothetical protein FGO68_gene16860 [Halteria grandinella]|uniref:14-3-3 domain-containing protein n=1 Tax=Halteria grandinella TaxID=5974 RepID=A0A8J8NM34_HALGN|nr:hypothetical protein FGO68_gene16860 [Halteria grandinella]
MLNIAKLILENRIIINTSLQRETITQRQAEEEEDDPKYEEDDDQFNATDRVLLQSAFTLYYNQLRDKADFYRSVEKAMTFSQMMERGSEIPQFKNKHTGKILELCTSIAKLAETYSKQQCTHLTRIFLNKLTADAKRFLISSTVNLVDHFDEADIEIQTEESLSFYEEAIRLADGEEQGFGALRKCNALRLQVYNNYAVFKREIQGKKQESLQVVRQTLKEAEGDLENEKNSVRFDESKRMIQLLRENIQAWESDEKDQEQ